MLRREAEYFLAALRFLTHLPVPQRIGHSQEQLDAGARHFPLVGWLVGGIGAGATFIAAQLAPFEVAVLLGMAATLLWHRRVPRGRFRRCLRRLRRRRGQGAHPRHHEGLAPGAFTA